MNLHIVSELIHPHCDADADPGCLGRLHISLSGCPIRRRSLVIDFRGQAWMIMYQHNLRSAFVIMKDLIGFQNLMLRHLDFGPADTMQAFWHEDVHLNELNEDNNIYKLEKMANDELKWFLGPSNVTHYKPHGKDVDDNDIFKLMWTLEFNPRHFRMAVKTWCWECFHEPV